MAEPSRDPASKSPTQLIGEPSGQGTEQASGLLRKPRRGVYLLPNLFTTAALFAGFFAIIAAINNRFEHAAIAVLVAMVLDGLDGRIARLTNTSSEFGAQYDSMSDLVSFGLAPALIMYEWSLHTVARQGFGNTGWLAAFLFTACAALRLARFNVQLGTVDKRFFQGLASPSAAALVVCTVWVFHTAGFGGSEVALLAMVVTIGAGLLMVSNFMYYSFKDFGASQRVPFMALLVLVMVFVFASLDPPKVLFFGFVVYSLSGPVYACFRWLRKRRQ